MVSPSGLSWSLDEFPSHLSFSKSSTTTSSWTRDKKLEEVLQLLEEVEVRILLETNFKLSCDEVRARICDDYWGWVKKSVLAQWTLLMTAKAAAGGGHNGKMRFLIFKKPFIMTETCANSLRRLFLMRFLYNAVAAVLSLKNCSNRPAVFLSLQLDSFDCWLNVCEKSLPLRSFIEK